jgi:hypothetical protein
MKWVSDIILALRSLGGNGMTSEIYHWIETNRPGPFPENWKSTIRATLQAYAPGSPQYRDGNPALFVNKSRGCWALESPKNANSVIGHDMAALLLAFERLSNDDIAACKNDEDFFSELAARAREMGPPLKSNDNS